MIYQHHQNDNTETFAQALRDVYLSEYPMQEAQKVFNLAWEKGHSHGYSEVELEYMDLADLVKTIVQPAKN